MTCESSPTSIDVQPVELTLIGYRQIKLRPAYALFAAGVALTALALWVSTPDPARATRHDASGEAIALKLPQSPTAAGKPAVADTSIRPSTDAPVTPDRSSEETGSHTTPTVWQEITVKKGDTLAGIFSRLGLSPTQVKQARQAFFAQCTYVDHQLRLVLGLLREEGLMDNTIVGFTSDHGDMLGNHGQYGKSILYEEAAKIPFILVPTSDYTHLGHHQEDDEKGDHERSGGKLAQSLGARNETPPGQGHDAEEDQNREDGSDPPEGLAKAAGPPKGDAEAVGKVLQGDEPEGEKPPIDQGVHGAGPGALANHLLLQDHFPDEADDPRPERL